MTIRQKVCCYQEETVADGQEELEHLDLVLQLHDEELMVPVSTGTGLSVLVLVSLYWYGLCTGTVSLYWYDPSGLPGLTSAKNTL